MKEHRTALGLIITGFYLIAFQAGAVPAGETANIAQPSPRPALAHRLRILSIQADSQESGYSDSVALASQPLAYPQPPVMGFSPLVAITTSDARTWQDFDWEHSLEGAYVGRELNAPADENFVVGVLDTGSVVDLAAGQSALMLGLEGNNLTSSAFPLGGTGGMIEAQITQPMGFFTAGLGAIDADGILDLTRVVGHTNVCGLAAPEISCDNGEEIRAVVGTPLLAFYTTEIRVDQPRKVVVRGKRYISPNVELFDFYSPSPVVYPRRIPIALGGLSPVTTASYYAFPDLDDILGEMLPLTPTLLSLSSMSIPTGANFYTELSVAHGEIGPLNPVQTMRVLLDTGAQGSTISSNMAARLNLPLEPDFTAEVCGIGGLTQASGYYIDYVRINAMGGAMEFARVPFIVIDMESPEGGSLDGILGMNFFWNRNLVLEPTVGGAGFLHVSDPVPYAYIDLNYDDVVDVTDFAIFASAWHATPADPTWNVACDFFTDELIDRRDLQAFADAWVAALQP
ncbi:MAG: aspartyl protease family protein [Sedimentisphaerales bacterium]|nr:aspartyl protease family protein [Sedimentisphaerales bacterium]